MEDDNAFSWGSIHETLATIQGIEDIPFEVENKGDEDEYDGEENMEEGFEDDSGDDEFMEGGVSGVDEEEESVDNLEGIGINYSDALSDDEYVMVNIDSVDDIGKLDLCNFGEDEVVNVDFISLEVAFLFYCLFARVKGFAVRKSKVRRSKNGDIVQQTFVCNRAGYREDRGLTLDQRQRRGRFQTRCGCEAQIRVHVDKASMRWCVTYFSDCHNHDMMDPKYVVMLPPFRKMGELDIMEMNYYRNAGIPANLMYGSFACQSGGYENIGFSQKQIYNQIGKQKKKQQSDAKGCLDYLSGLGVTDGEMYFSHTVDGEGRLQHVFWSDGNSQMDYKVFGDVLAFDATYRKNKYRCPVVVFSGVNHHNQTIVFAAAVISNETEETYLWLLNEFLKAMKGKSPLAVVTDGDAAMRNAIKVVFPNAHHRLCAWHLSRNATTNVGITGFTHDFNKCMLGDIDVGQFQQMWKDMIEKYGLEDNGWVGQIYEKRKMWAVAYMRGKFFGGLRTTSRCEGLNAQIGRYVRSRYDLTEFVQHFNRCVNHMRFKEYEADFASHCGEPVLETEFHSLERSGSLIYTRALFSIYRGVLSKSSGMVVVGCREASNFKIYVVVRSGGSGRQFCVSFYPSCFEFKCGCLKMESIGIPCEHIIAVLVYLEVEKLPKSLVLDRWTKFAKDSLQAVSSDGTKTWPSQLICRYAILMQQFRELASLACKSFDHYCSEREKVRISLQELRLKLGSLEENERCAMGSMQPGIRDPAQVASRGRSSLGASSSAVKSKRKNRCGNCNLFGHNKKTCKSNRGNGGTMDSQFGVQSPMAEDCTVVNNEYYFDPYFNEAEYGV